jgi:hypothetical protein
MIEEKELKFAGSWIQLKLNGPCMWSKTVPSDAIDVSTYERSMIKGKESKLAGNWDWSF